MVPAAIDIAEPMTYPDPAGVGIETPPEPRDSMNTPLKPPVILPFALTLLISQPASASPAADSRELLKQFATAIRLSRKADKTECIKALSNILLKLEGKEIAEFGYNRGLTPLICPYAGGMKPGKRLESEVLCTRGELYLTMKKTSLASRDFDRSLSLSTGHYEAIMGKAVIAITNRDLSRAHKLLNAAISIDRENPKAFVARTLIYEMTGEKASRDEALARSRQLERFRNTELARWIRTTNDTSALKNYPAIRKVLGLSPRDPAIISFLASALSTEGKQALALDTVDMAGNLDPDSEMQLLVRSKILSKLHRGKEAAFAAQRVLSKKPDSETALNNLAVAQLEMGRLEEATGTFSKLIRLKPGNPIYLVNRADAYVKAGRNGLAIKDADSALRLDPQMSLAMNNKAVALINLKRYQEAESLLDQVLARHPLDWLALVNRCVSRINLGKPEAAALDLDRAFKLDPRSCKSLVKNTVVKRRNEPSKADLLQALFIADRVARFTPDDAQVYYNRALIYFNLDSPAKAAGDLRKFLEVANWQGKSSVCAAILCYLADRKAGKGESARQILDQASARCPGAGSNLELNCFLGKVPETSLLARSRSKALKTRAHCYLGLRASINGESEKAMEHLEWVRRHGEKKMDEYVLSLVELCRQEKRPEP